MRRLGTWLGMVALALQLAWPLLVSAKPGSVALVPLCTVDGVTHYLEVPTGKTPLEESSSHGNHCPLCYLGHAPAVSGVLPSLVVLCSANSEALPVRQVFTPRPVVLGHEARAPPSADRG